MNDIQIINNIYLPIDLHIINYNFCQPFFENDGRGQLPDNNSILQFMCLEQCPQCKRVVKNGDHTDVLRGKG
jgi:hypothetical protein